MQDNSPAWLKSPPEGGFPNPPIDTRAQTLPFGELTWENFEKLIRRVVRREATIAECWVYGDRGQNQHGLDILASRRETPGDFACYQCKRVNKFSANNIKKTVDTFLEGKWADKTKSFALCTSLALNDTKQIDEIVAQRTRLAVKGIEFQVWDGSEGGHLSERLKQHPDIVDDFFLREWVRRFNGNDAAKSLDDRLDGSQLAKLRSQLQSVYATLFNRHDQGLRLDSKRPVSLLDRYIAPAVIETRAIVTSEGMPKPVPKEQDFSETKSQQTQSTPIQSNSVQEIRTSVGEWLSRHDKMVILGEPGCGKSALLRVIALQLLNDRDDHFSLPWNGLLPVWVSFGGFSTAIQEQPGLSLEDYFDRWLHQNGADDARPLFRRAIKKGEMLLLLDGLDEGQDVNAAKQAMDRISAFLSIRPTPSVFTSRPRGYERVRPDGTWPIARLGFFDDEQIERFSRIWFEYMEAPELAAKVEMAGAGVNAERRTSDFLKAIRANPRVLELARTPLFCQLLIDIFRYSHHLPEQRIKVYEKIVEMLLFDHPAARIQAAGSARIDIPKLEDMRDMLMRLALHIQEEGGAGVISVVDCQASFCDFLTDDINGPSLSNYEAMHQARSIVEYAQAGLGLIVERAPNELGFFHLTIQEYLAAQAMVRKDEETQLAWLVRVWDQPKWHEVVLAWFSIRGAEQGKGATQRAIDCLKESAISNWSRLQLLCLRTELAANEFGLSPREARTTIDEAADLVEITPFPELRQALAKQIALGLRSPSVASLCESRISNWTPARPEWSRSSLLEALGNWQASDDLLHTLKLALHDESGRCRRAAAESLAKVFSSDAAIGDYLAAMAANWPDTGVRSAAMHSLWKGWSAHAALDGLADAARRSMDMDLALTGITIRVSKNSHDDDDRRLIWFMFSNGSVSYELRDTCREVLVQGWGKDDEFKHLAMEGLRNPHDFTSSDREQLMSFLAHAWPGDAEVASSIAQWFETFSPLFIHGRSHWKSLFTGFRGNAGLSNVIRQSLLKHRSEYKAIHWGPDTKWANCTIGDETAKAEVLDAYSIEAKSRDKYWIASTLMDAWGNDSEVRGILAQEYQKPPGEVAFLANWIDSFIPEPKARRAWLLEAVSHADRRIVDAPVSRLMEEFQDDECLTAIKVVLAKDIWYYNKISFQSRLIEIFPNDEDVRKWVETAFEDIDGPSIASIATSHEQDQTIRARLLAAARPAWADARAEVFRVLREHPIPAQSGSRLTAVVWAEGNGQIRTSGVLARCIASQQLPEPRESLVRKLQEEINSLGSYYEERRRSSFAGLLQLGEYETCVEELTKESPSPLHWLAEYHKADSLTARTFFEHWGKPHETSQALGRSFEVPWGGLIYNGTAREALVNGSAREQLIAYLKTMPIQDRTPESLSLMAELFPGSAELRARLIETIKKPGMTFPPQNSALEAQRIYAEQFGGDEQALGELGDSWVPSDEVTGTTQPFSSFLYALALGWPDNPALRSCLQQDELPKLPIPIVLALCGINGNEKTALACIDRMIEITQERGHTLPVPYIQGLRQWALTTPAESLLQRLTNDPNCSRVITATRLLSITGKLNDANRMEMIRKFDAALEDAAKPCPDGVDLVNGTVTTLPQAIVRTLFMGVI